MSPGHCALSSVAGLTVWPSPKGKGYTKVLPKGVMIERLFTDWNKGLLTDRAKKAVSQEVPDFKSLCEIATANDCADLSLCQRWGPHVLEDLGVVFERGEAWRLMDAPLRRALVLLAFLGKGGMRPGGYLRSDIRKMAGVRSNSSTDRIIEWLCATHILARSRKRGAWPRFRYVRPDFLARLVDDVDSRMWNTDMQFWEKASSEYMRRYARRLVVRLDKIVPRTKGRLTRGKNYAELTSGILVGYQPPDWYIDILQEYLRLMTISTTIPLKGPTSRPAPREGWLGGQEEFRRLFERTASRLIQKIKAIPEDEAWWWNRPFDLDKNDALVVLELPFGERYNIDVKRPETPGSAYD